MRLEVWWAYFFACWAIALSPGSGAVLSMSHGLSYGVRAASVTIAGLQVGLVLVLLIAGAGLGALLLASETAFAVVKWAGAAYLVWLGLQQWRAGVSITNAAQRLPPLSARRRFLSGLMTNATNPKGIVFMVAVLPQFIDPGRPLGMQLLILALTMCTVDVIVMHGYAALAARLQGLLRTPGAMRWLNRTLGGVLMGMGAALAAFKRQPL
ncbi:MULTISPECIES: homoserine/homoserine lactone efflux protein [Caldimonas]|jgi:homoserine/homoserine lactone efflux protein|uniref:homoserine/homoserine lactone efflux protein n=1 Tax=Caldimonas TaxID=196013 RepID=UPI00036FE2B8|nr:homoserine/homoserine lactone efflux protein [Caldimonas manganoxidans]